MQQHSPLTELAKNDKNDALALGLKKAPWRVKISASNSCKPDTGAFCRVANLTKLQPRLIMNANES